MFTRVLTFTTGALLVVASACAPAGDESIVKILFQPPAGVSSSVAIHGFPLASPAPLAWSGDCEVNDLFLEVEYDSTRKRRPIEDVILDGNWVSTFPAGVSFPSELEISVPQGPGRRIHVIGTFKTNCSTGVSHPVFGQAQVDVRTPATTVGIDVYLSSNWISAKASGTTSTVGASGLVDVELRYPGCMPAAPTSVHLRDLDTGTLYTVSDPGDATLHRQFSLGSIPPRRRYVLYVNSGDGGPEVTMEFGFSTYGWSSPADPIVLDIVKQANTGWDCS